MISQNQNSALLIVGNAALRNVEWKLYSSYCFAREKGLRSEAFKHLESFLKSTSRWTVEDRREFVKFLFPYFEEVEDADYGPFPQPLSEMLVKPTLEEWCKDKVSDSLPFRWYGIYYGSEEHLFKALELNPKDDIARKTLLSRWAYNIYYSVHHLPQGYIGDPYEDLKLSEKIYNNIALLQNEEQRKKWKEDVDEDMELVKNYIEWERSKTSSFKEWGLENNRKTSY